MTDLRNIAALHKTSLKRCMHLQQSQLWPEKIKQHSNFATTHEGDKYVRTRT
jgi:hypothetical protein